jgi:multiple sugar transport system permease protein
MRRTLRLQTFFSYLLLIVGGAGMLVPLLWMISTSLKDPSAAVSYPPELIPRVQETWHDQASDRTLQVFLATIDGRRVRVARVRMTKGEAIVRVLDAHDQAGPEVTVPLQREVAGRMVPALEPSRHLFIRWANYRDAWHALALQRPWFAMSIGGLHFAGFNLRDAFLAFYLNAIIVTVTVTLGQVFTSSLAGFAFARLRFRARDVLFLGYLATMMVPHVVTMIPVFILLRVLGLIDTYSAMILPAMFSAYGTFLLRQFFLSIPPDLEDAARLDGCGDWGVYRHVVMPLSRPALAALATFVFLGTWNSFMWPLIVMNSTEKMPLMLGLYSFMGQYNVEWGLLMAASVMAMIPVILVFIFGQRYFVQGVVLSGLKG